MGDYYIFTFGQNSPNRGRCVKLFGSYTETRKKMFELFGCKWAFQYSEADWNKICEDETIQHEVEIPTEEALRNVDGAE